MNNDDMTSGDHGHDDHGHADAAHSPEPLPDVDAAALHATVDDIAAALHEYVVTATGVRAEFGAHEADEDPRILSVESRVSTLNATFYDLVHGRLGIHSDLTGMTWDDEAHDDAGDDEAHDDELETFHLGFVVGPRSVRRTSRWTRCSGSSTPAVKRSPSGSSTAASRSPSGARRAASPCSSTSTTTAVTSDRAWLPDRCHGPGVGG